jgi:hypothetical protein
MVAATSVAEWSAKKVVSGRTGTVPSTRILAPSENCGLLRYLWIFHKEKSI